MKQKYWVFFMDRDYYGVCGPWETKAEAQAEYEREVEPPLPADWDEAFPLEAASLDELHKQLRHIQDDVIAYLDERPNGVAH